MTIPALFIRIEVESLAPAVYADAVNESEFDRLAAWLEAQPQLHELLARAWALQGEARAA